MNENLTHWKGLTDRKYIASWEFEQGEVKTFEILSVSKQEVTGTGGKKTLEPVAFLKDSKPFVLNSENMNMIELIAGSPYVEKWKGITIDVYVDHDVKFAGKKVGGLRVMFPDSKPAAKPKVKEKTPLVLGSDEFNKAVAFITDPDNSSDGFENLFTRLSGRYKISPNVKKELESKFNENAK